MCKCECEHSYESERLFRLSGTRFLDGFPRKFRKNGSIARHLSTLGRQAAPEGVWLITVVLYRLVDTGTLDNGRSV